MAPQTLDIFLFPSGFDIIMQAKGVSQQQAYTSLKDWLWKHGYQAIGEPVLNWDTYMNRQLRQPIMPRFSHYQPEANIRLVERPELLMVALAIPTRDGLYNLAGIYDLIQEYGLDPIGAPYIPIAPYYSQHITHSLGYIPVVPQGTTRLFPRHSWIAGKTGLQVALPELCQPLAKRFALQQTAVLITRIIIMAGMLVLIISPLIAALAWALDPIQAMILWKNMVLSLAPLGILTSILLVWSASTLYRRRLSSIQRWNSFWASMPTPPLLTFTEVENGDTTTT